MAAENLRRIPPTMASSISSRAYGISPTGASVEAWTLAGHGGVALEVITLGGIVTRLLAPGRDDAFDDVVLGFDNLDSYVAGHPYFGAITGRVAGRISSASFALNGRPYELARNDPPNHLHGGTCGFDKRIWSAASIARHDGAPSLRLTYHSPDGEEGYPGNVDVAITYTVTHDNAFLIESEAVSDRVTPLNLTHHSYFNLAGEQQGSIADHRLTLFADNFVPTDKHMTLSGHLTLVDRTNDFRCPSRLGDMIPDLYYQHGDLYALPTRRSGDMKLAACLEHPASNRTMKVFTTCDYLQLYTGRSLNGLCTGKSGVAYGPYAGMCLECEGYPDAANPELRNGILLQPGQVQRHTTAYAFSVRKDERKPISQAARNAVQVK
jgi:aldose 1-epimerase